MGNWGRPELKTTGKLSWSRASSASALLSRTAYTSELEPSPASSRPRLPGSGLSRTPSPAHVGGGKAWLSGVPMLNSSTSISAVLGRGRRGGCRGSSVVVGGLAGGCSCRICRRARRYRSRRSCRRRRCVRCPSGQRWCPGSRGHRRRARRRGREGVVELIPVLFAAFLAAFSSLMLCGVL